MRALPLTLAAVAAVLLPAPARADSVNCRPGTLVETGYTMEQVFKKCGAPSQRVPAVGGNLRAEHWVYVPAGSHARVLQFYDGVLQRIRIMHG